MTYSSGPGEPRIISIALFGAALLFFYGCTSLAAPDGEQTGRESLTRRVFAIRFDETVPVSIGLDKTGFHEPGKAYRIRIEYVEQANLSGVIASVPSEFLNVFFLAYGFFRGGSFIATSTQVVIDIWEHDPEANTKVCHQWLLIDNDVDDNVDTVYAESFTENRWNVLQETHPISYRQEEMERYSELFCRCLSYVLQRLGLVSLSDAHPV